MCEELSRGSERLRSTKKTTFVVMNRAWPQRDCCRKATWIVRGPHTFNKSLGIQGSWVGRLVRSWGRTRFWTRNFQRGRDLAALTMWALQHRPPIQTVTTLYIHCKSIFAANFPLSDCHAGIRPKWSSLRPHEGPLPRHRQATCI